MEETKATAPQNGASEPAAADAVQNDADELGRKLVEYENKLGEMRDLLLRERAEI